MISPAQALTLLCLAVLVAAALAYTAGHARRGRRTLRTEVAAVGSADTLHTTYTDAVRLVAHVHRHGPVSRRDAPALLGISERRWRRAGLFAQGAGALGRQQAKVCVPYEAMRRLERYYTEQRRLHRPTFVPPW